MAVIPPPNSSIFQYPPNFPNGQVSDAWLAYFQSIDDTFATAPGILGAVSYAVLADVANAANGSGKVGYNAGLIYPAGTIGKGVEDEASARVAGDAQIRTDLLSLASSSMAAGQVGYNSTITYPINTVGAGIQGVVTTAAASAAAAAGSATAAATAAQSALMSRGIFGSTSDALSNGVTSINSLIGGSGGTSGSYALSFGGGGGYGTSGTFTVAGGSVVPGSINITSGGFGFTSAPTVSFSSCPGLGGASATCVISANAPLYTYFSIPHSTGASILDLYYVNTGPAAVYQASYPSNAALLDLRSNTLMDVAHRRVILSDVGFYASSATTGAFKIKLPVGLPQQSMEMEVTISDNYGQLKLHIAGFNNTGAWHYGNATVVGDHPYNPVPNVRFGNDGTGDCIWIGELAYNTWNYPNVWIDRVNLSIGSTGGASGWAITLVGAFDTVTLGPVTPVGMMNTVNPFFSGTMNGAQLNFSGILGQGQGSTYIGYDCGTHSSGSGTYNVAVGYNAAQMLTTGYNNTFIGMQSGMVCTIGYANAGCGLQTLFSLTTGSFNSAIDIHALYSLLDGQANNAIGAGCMEYLVHGSNNNALGMYAGRSNEGSGNLFLGNYAGINSTTDNNQLWISNSATQNLIRGDFVANRVWVGGGSDDGANTLQVNGPLKCRPASFSTPVNNGDLTFEATSNTTIKLKFKGSDGIVRSATLTLS